MRWITIVASGLRARIIGRAGIAVPAAALLLSCGYGASGDPEAKLSLVRLPEGFSISVYTSEVPGARSMAVSPNGTLYVGTRSGGSVYAVSDEDGDGIAEKTSIVASDLDTPNGVAFWNGSLYIAEISRILRIRDIEASPGDPPLPNVVFDALPTDTWHGQKYIAFGPDSLLYVPVGAPCNVCEKDDPYAAIARMRPDGSDFEIFARGVRNTLGFDWHPETGELWFTDNGRDMMGDDIPPDELNHAPRAGLHFGFPYFHGVDVADPEYGGDREASAFTAPAARLGAHVAALGAEFYEGRQFPEEYRHRLFVAEHGSWNRSSKVGYRVMVARVDPSGTVETYEPFATGWLQGQENWGRPVDLEELPDGSLLVSDDQSGAIYRITYQEPHAG
jgi:glucose/arabinose dehydrogenase